MSPTHSASLILAIAVLALTPLIPSMSGISSTRTASLYESLGQYASEDTTKNNIYRSPAPEIEAPIAFVFDPLTDTTIYGKNENQLFGLASLTKIMTAIIALEHAEENDFVLVSADAVATEGIAGYMKTGEHLRIKDLIAMMMIESSNDAAVSIAEHIGMLRGGTSFEDSQRIFVSLMNTKAIELGLGQTAFQNPTGLDIDEEAGIVSNVSTAKDVARMTSYAGRYTSLWEYSQFSTFRIESFEGIVHELTSINPLPHTTPGIIGGKTGFTDTVGGSLVSLAEIPLGQPVIVVILGSSKNGRFTDTLYLVDWLRN